MTRISLKRLLGWACILVAGFAAPAGADPDFAAAEAELVPMLQRAIRMDTSNPPGNTAELAAYFAEQLRAAGLEPEVFESEPGQVHVLARLKGDGSARPLLLMNHMDVVAAEAAEWTHDPFAAEIVDGNLYGRGALDTKGLGVLQVQVMRLLARSDVPLKRDIIFYAAPDEEAGGGRGAGWMTQHRWADVDVEYVLTEGATARRDAFGEGSRVYFVQTGEKGVCWVRMTARGTSGHGSRPTPDNPNLYLLRALKRITDHDTPVRLVPTVAKSLRELAPLVGGETGALWARAGEPDMLARVTPSLLADEMFNPIVRTTINLTNIQSGYKANVVPSTATAILDCRILPGETPDGLLSLLQSLAHDPDVAEQERRREAELGRALTPEESRQVTFEFILKGEATESDIASPIYRAIEDVLGEADPRGAVVPRLSAGGTDARFWRERGVDAYGFAPFMLTVEQRATVHGRNEFLQVAELQRALKVYYEIVRRVATAP